MLPALLAAKPVIRYAILIGGPILILLISHTSLYVSGKNAGKKQILAEWNAAIALQAEQSVQQAIQAHAMESAVVKSADSEERTIEVKAEQLKKKVVAHARKNPQPLTPATVALYDRLIRLPNETGHDLPAPDPGAGKPEVPRGGMAVETVTGIQDEDGNNIILTTEELAQAAVDFAEKYALMKNAYQALSAWNDGREAIELKRLTDE